MSYNCDSTVSYLFKGFIFFVVGVYSDQVKGPIFLFHSLSSGVTQVLFSSCGKFLYSGERKVWLMYLILDKTLLHKVKSISFDLSHLTITKILFQYSVLIIPSMCNVRIVLH